MVYRLAIAGLRSEPAVLGHPPLATGLRVVTMACVGCLQSSNAPIRVQPSQTLEPFLPVSTFAHTAAVSGPSSSSSSSSSSPATGWSLTPLLSPASVAFPFAFFLLFFFFFFAAASKCRVSRVPWKGLRCSRRASAGENGVCSYLTCLSSPRH